MSRYGMTYTDIKLKDHNEPGGCPLNLDQIVQPGITERTMSVPDKPPYRKLEISQGPRSPDLGSEHVARELDFGEILTLSGCPVFSETDEKAKTIKCRKHEPFSPLTAVPDGAFALVRKNV